MTLEPDVGACWGTDSVVVDGTRGEAACEDRRELRFESWTERATKSFLREICSLSSLQ